MQRSLVAAVAAVIAVMSALMVVRWNVWSFGVDTGTFAQIVINAFSGFTDGPEGGTHFRFHWSPILAALWPIVAATHSALSLQFVQVVLIAIAPLPLAAIVRTYAGDTWAFRAGLLALIYPPLLSVAFDEFHELAFYPVLALALIWAADRARWGWFAVLSLALVLIREDVCVDLVVIGMVLGVMGLARRRSNYTGLLRGEPIEPERLALAGFALAALCASVLALYAFIVVPRAGGWSPSHFYQYSFARGPLQTALSVFTHPIALGAAVLTLGRLTYVLEAFAPIAFLPLFTRWTWLALPGFAGVLLASGPMVWRMGFHYSLLWAPWLLLAAAWALVRIAERRGEEAARRWWVAAVGITVVVLIAFNPMHPVHYLTRAPYQHSADVARAFRCVPHDAPVATHDEWFAHIALAYPHSTYIGKGVEHFDGYIVYARDWRNDYVDTYILPRLAAAREQGRYAAICTFGDVVVLRPVGAQP